jgi:hypothetical protein
MWIGGVFNRDGGGGAPKVDRLGGKYRLRQRKRRLPRPHDPADAALPAGCHSSPQYRRVMLRRQPDPPGPLWKTAWLTVLALGFSYAAFQAIATGVTQGRGGTMSAHDQPYAFYFRLGLYALGAILLIKSLFNSSKGAPYKGDHRRRKRLVMGRWTRRAEC